MSRSSVKDKGHQGQKAEFFGTYVACVRFVSGKTSLASSLRTFVILQRRLIQDVHKTLKVCFAKRTVRITQDHHQ